MPLVEITLRFTADDHFGPAQHAAAVRYRLVNGGILEIGEDFPKRALPGDQIGAYTPDGKRKERPTTHILKQALLECGITEELIAETTFGKEVIFEILDSGKPGDLLVMVMGNVEILELAGFIDEYIAVRGLQSGMDKFGD